VPEDSRLAVDDTGLAIVEAGDQHLGRGERHDDGPVALAPYVLSLELRQVEAGDHVAGSEKRQFVPAERVRDQIVRLGDGADMYDMHRRGLQPVERTHACDHRGEVDLFFVCGEDLVHGAMCLTPNHPSGKKCEADHADGRHQRQNQRFSGHEKATLRRVIEILLFSAAPGRIQGSFP